MSTVNILVDCDMIAYKASSAVEVVTKWDHNLFTLHSDGNEAIEKLENIMSYSIKRIMEHTKAKNSRVIMMISDRENFRKDILPTYKASRADKRKPICYNFVIEYVEKNYEFMREPKLESDDLMVIHSEILPNTCVLSGDKDLLQAKGLVYSHLTDKFTFVTPELALYTHYFQCLVGDKADFYEGVPGIGKVTAEKLLKESCTWEIVESAYRKKNIGYDEMMQQCRVAKLLTKDLYNHEKQEIKLWNPYAQ